MIIPSKTSIVMESPAGENRWGFYQFPDMWRAAGTPGREIYCAVNVGHDSLLGDHEPNRFFVSKDDGATWRAVPFSEVDRSPHVFTFSDGSQVAFGTSHFIYHAHGYGPFQEEWQSWNFGKMGVKPIDPRHLPDGYDGYHWQIFRVGDIPKSERGFPRRFRASASAAWQEDWSDIDAPDLHSAAVSRPGWWDESGKPFWKDVSPTFLRMWPRWGNFTAQVMPDDSILWAQVIAHPAESLKRGHMYWALALLESRDKGKTWRFKSMIADDTDQTTDGYSGDEHSMRAMPNGDLFCVMRTVLGDRPGSTMHLAATRSRNGGKTWSRPPHVIGAFSVTPLMMTLNNGMVAVAYGRPGVYIRASADSGKTWNDVLPVVGPTEEELMKNRATWDVEYHQDSSDKISCGNLGAVVTGPDRFLLAYSDFRHTNAKGEPCKVVKTTEFIVRPD